jgi:MbtH protein
MSWYDPDREDTTIYKVVVNHEEQYSIWPEYKENPLGWNNVGKSGPKADCLAFIKEVWTDMRPLSLRKWLRIHQHRHHRPTPTDLEKRVWLKDFVKGTIRLKQDSVPRRLLRCLRRPSTAIMFMLNSQRRGAGPNWALD